MNILPRITLYGEGKEAIKYYQELFGAEVTEIVTFGEATELANFDLDDEKKGYIYYAELAMPTDTGTLNMILGDTPSIVFSNVSNSNLGYIAFEIKDNDKERITNIYNVLMDGGKANRKLQQNEIYELYASVIDKYGICWNLCCK